MAGMALAWPLKGVKPFRPKASYRRTGYGKTAANPGGFHVGVDLPCPNGTIIRALRRGEVVWRGWYGDMGYMICVYDPILDITFGYCHLKSFGGYTAGEAVPTGGALGRGDDTGNSSGHHLHMFGRSGRWVPKTHAWGSISHPFVDIRPLLVEVVQRAA